MTGRKRGASRAVLPVLFALSCAWVVCYHALVNVLPYEDAYIGYRYAANLAAGRGWASNPGEAVQACTSPLHTVLLAGLSRVIPSQPVPSLAVKSNALFYVLAALATALLVRRLAGSAALGWIAGILFAWNPAALALSSSGKEMFLFVALALAAALTAWSDRLLTSGLLASLAVLARPEGAITGALLWLISVRRRPDSGRWLIAFTLPLGVWGAWTLFRFGTPMPHSLTAKLLPVYPVAPWSAALTLAHRIGEWTVPAGFPAGSAARDALSVALAAAGAAGLVLRGPVRARGGLYVAAALMALWLFYALANPLLFDWYLATIFAFWFAAILAGIPSLPAPDSRTARIAGAAAVAILAAGVLIPIGGDFALGRDPMEAARSAIRLRCKTYREAAVWLNGFAAPGSVLLAPESGAVGYEWTGRLLDASGLSSPEALRYLPAPPESRPDPAEGAVPIAVPVEMVRDLRPDYIVSLQIFIEKTLLPDPWFDRAYRRIRRFPLPKPVWGTDAVLVMQRVDLPPPPEEPVTPP